MDLSKMSYLHNTGKYFAEVHCDRCKCTPAVKLEADCHGDAMSLCKAHWKEWFESELMPVFDFNINENFEKADCAKYPEIQAYLDKRYLTK